LIGKSTRATTDDPPVVILGGAANALSAARSLGRSGRAVHVLLDRPGHAPVTNSRYVASCLPALEGADRTTQWRAWFRMGPAGAVVLPCGDIGLTFLAHHRDELTEQGYRPVPAADSVVLAMLDKQRTFELASAAGVEVPRVASVSSVEDLDRLMEDMSFPCAFKPRRSHENVTGRKGIIVHNRAQLNDTYHWLCSVSADMLVTEVVPGVDDTYCSYYSYLDDDGAPLVHFTKRKIRQHPPVFGDLGSYHSTRWYPDAAEIGLRFFQAIGLRGIGNVEFKRDARDGRLKLIECNPRLTAATELVRRSGVDLAEIGYQRALGRPVDPQWQFTPGMYLWLPGLDFQALRAYRRQGTLSTARWLASVARPQTLTVFNHDDLLPAAGVAGQFARRGLRRTRRVLRGRITAR
jgi:D-aspartate ligase